MSLCQDLNQKFISAEGGSECYLSSLPFRPFHFPFPSFPSPLFLRTEVVSQIQQKEFWSTPLDICIHQTRSMDSGHSLIVDISPERLQSVPLQQ